MQVMPNYTLCFKKVHPYDFHGHSTFAACIHRSHYATCSSSNTNECSLLTVRKVVDFSFHCDCNVSGPASDRLLQVKLNIIPHNTCARMWGPRISKDHHICVGSKPTVDQGGTCTVCAFSVLYSWINLFIQSTQSNYFTSYMKAPPGKFSKGAGGHKTTDIYWRVHVAECWQLLSTRLDFQFVIAVHTYTYISLGVWDRGLMTRPASDRPRSWSWSYIYI